MKSVNYICASLLILFLLPISLFSQATIKGIILDENNEAAIGANVVITGTTKGTVTEFDGTYTIENVPAGEASVTASYVGYKNLTKTITVSDSGTFSLDFQLGVDTENLEEVVVIGYGTQRRRELVGNIAKIESSDLNDQVGSTFETALQGKSPGLQITQGSGTAGSHSVIRIRGTSSVSAGGDPLFVIDGVPVSQDNYLLGEAGGQNNNPLSTINPADIESVEVLKDASAAAIYGSRAANGVILITTKRGKAGKPTFNYTSRFGIAKPTNIVDVLDADEWIAVRQEAWENSGNVGRVPLPNGLSYDDIKGIDTDWIDAVIQTGYKQEHNLSMRAGNKWLASYAGLTYSKNESYLIKNAFERVSGRVNFDITPTDNFKISISSSVVRGTRDKTPQAWAGGLGWAQSTALPIYPIGRAQFDRESSQYNPAGWYNLYGNPVAQVYLQKLQTREWRYLNNLQLSYSPTESLTFTAQASYDFTNIGDYTYEKQEWTGSTPISKANLFKVKNRNVFATGEYVISLPENHNLKVLVGSEYQQYNNESVFVEDNRFTGQYFEVQEYREQLDSLNYFPGDAYKFFSLFTRVNYSYKDKYYVQGVFRRDASSKFGTNNRWGNFPSIGVGYIVSEEDFWPKEKSFVNYMKFKASWGLTGNSNIPWTEQFATFAFNTNPGTVNNGLNYNGDTQHQIKEANADLQWERVSTIDVGVDLGMMDDRITTGITYYRKITNGALLREFLAASSGYDELQLYRNVGKIRNQGVEFELKTRNFVGKFSWTTEFNIAMNRNIVLDVGNATPDALDGGFGDTRVIEGQPIGVNYIVRFSHVDPTSGRPVYLDADGNETFEYNPATMRVAAGNIQPDFTGGLRNTFKYKNFDLSFLIYFSKGGTIYDDAAKRQQGVISDDWNYTYAIFDRWREPGDVADFPQYSTTMLEWGGSGNIWQNNHTLWLHDASFARLRNLSIGYNIRPKKGSAFTNIRLTLSGTNLMTFTKYPGWDPEIARDRSQEQERNVGGTNITYLTPPQEKSFIFGASFDF